MNTKRLLIVLAVIALWDLCRVSDDRVAFAESLRDSKTLFHWAESYEREDQLIEGVDRIVTDRPHFSEAASVVGLGRIQLETGYTYSRDTSGNQTVSTHSIGEPLLRAGILAEWFELRLGSSYLIESTRQNGNATSRLSGSDDLYLGAKLALTEQAGWLPEMAIFPQARIPTGSDDFSNDQVLPGFNFAYAWVVTDWLEIECNTQLNRRRDDSSHYYTEFIQTANLEYELTDRIGAFTEWIVFVPSGAITAQTQHYFHAGFVYLLTDHMQFDIHSAVGLNRAADDLAFTGVGFSIKY